LLNLSKTTAVLPVVGVVEKDALNVNTPAEDADADCITDIAISSISNSLYRACNPD
jgi:hypothetical protein